MKLNHHKWAIISKPSAKYFRGVLKKGVIFWGTLTMHIRKKLAIFFYFFIIKVVPGIPCDVWLKNNSYCYSCNYCLFPMFRIIWKRIFTNGTLKLNYFEYLYGESSYPHINLINYTAFHACINVAFSIQKPPLHILGFQSKRFRKTLRFITSEFACCK